MTTTDSIRAESIITLEPSGKLGRLCAAIRANALPDDVSLAVRRERFETVTARMALAPGVTITAVDAGGVPAEWVDPPGVAGPAPTLLYFHGGGYGMGSLNTIRALASQLAAASGARVLSVGYRLAPEHPFPAAVDDAIAAYRWLLEQGADPATVAFGGDSAGGGLTVAALLAARDQGLPSPAAGVCISPWVDMTLGSASIERNAATDPEAKRSHLIEWSGYYLAGTDPKTPLASPVYADLSGLPPLLVHAGTAEILEDDATRLAVAAGTPGCPSPSSCTRT